MVITETNEVPELPLPVYEMHEIGKADAAGQLFFIYAGLSKELADELKTRSLDDSDKEIQRMTSDRRRFGEGSYDAWYAKSRNPFALVDQSGHLAALAWLGPEQPPPHAQLGAAEWHTIAYRSYPPYRGRGVMKSFVTFALNSYAKRSPNARIWAGIHAENKASQSLSLGLGFTTAGEPHEGSIVMVKN